MILNVIIMRIANYLPKSLFFGQKKMDFSTRVYCSEVAIAQQVSFSRAPDVSSLLFLDYFERNI